MDMFSTQSKKNQSLIFANDGRQKVWTLDGHSILRLKKKEKEIMVSDFLLPWSQLNLFSLLSELLKHLGNSNIPLETVTYFEYGKTNEGYWTSEHLLNPITKKALSIPQTLYPGYELLFMFDNATSNLIYAKNALQVAYINKKPKDQQPFIWPGWYRAHDNKVVSQEMSTVVVNFFTGQSSIVQKGIQMVFVKRKLWP